MPEDVKREKDWIGVDLDGTLSVYHTEEFYGKYGPETIGEPIPEMVERVKAWVMEGKRVKIFTARISPVTAKYLGTQSWKMRKAVNQWLLDNLGFTLEITNQKDFAMIELWDDIVLRPVERNTGLEKIRLLEGDTSIKIDENLFVENGTHVLRCAPAVDVGLRHQMEELIEQHGFNIHGSGEFLTGESCDISFSKKKHDCEHCSHLAICVCDD